MAITRTQIARQLRRQGGIMGNNGGSMLVTPTRDGSRPGYYGPDEGHANDPGFGSNAPGNGNNRGRDTDFQQRGMSKKDYDKAVNRGDIGQNFSAKPSFFKGLQNKAQTLSLKNLYDIKERI